MIFSGSKNRLPTRTSAQTNFAAAPPADEFALVLKFARAEKAPSSRRAYRSDFNLFTRWCDVRSLCPLPATPEALAAFLASEAKRGVKPSSITRRVAGIRHANRLAGFEAPNISELVKATLRGIRRTIGTAPNRKQPLTAELIRAVVAVMPNTLIGIRDRALLLLGFAGALRRSELVALDVDDLKETKEGVRLRIRASKTDAEKSGATIAIPHGKKLCPVAAIHTWLKAARIGEGAIFRSIYKGGRVSPHRLSDRSVADIIKQYIDNIGADSARFSGHSLRAGFLTSAAKHGATLAKMMATSRHKSPETLLGYVREAEVFRDHAGEGLL
jgi:site-specific recombinase XerD